MNDICKGVARIANRTFRFAADSGMGLIRLDGRWTLVEFSCPFETLPPKGEGHVEAQTFTMAVIKGQLTARGQTIHMALEVDGEAIKESSTP